jgi:biopolymer transport protein ExbB/TolQ
MFTLFMQGGFYMWPLLLFAIIILVLSIKKIIDLFFKPDLSQVKLESGINSILFWGGMSVLIGFLGHFHGLYLAMQAISRASDISPAIVAMGYGVSLITVLFGLLILLISALIWFVLRWRLKKLTLKID